MPRWRPLTTSDLPDAEVVAAVVHPEFFERPEIFAERLALYPQGCWLLEDGVEPVGYVLSHPWEALSAPALDTLLGALPPTPGTYYLHDMALLPAARRTGAASAGARLLLDHATRVGFPSASLVAVNGSAGFWSRLGFVPTTAAHLQGKLLSYEPSACFMVRPLP